MWGNDFVRSHEYCARCLCNVSKMLANMFLQYHPKCEGLVKKREPLFDVAKAAAMFMVVYWHVMSYRPQFDLATMPSYAANFILSVNMPLFFVLSGYFSRRLHESGDGIKLLNRFISYFWPLAFWGVFWAIVESLVCGKYQWTNIPLWALKKFLFCGWFFYALAGCELITFFSFRFAEIKVRLLFLLASFVVCLCGAGRIWHTKEIVAMIPFYWFGIWLLPKLFGDKRCLQLMSVLGFVVIVQFYDRLTLPS